jgi:hypothetical protein
MLPPHLPPSVGAALCACAAHLMLPIDQFVLLLALLVAIPGGVCHRYISPPALKQCVSVARITGSTYIAVDLIALISLSQRMVVLAWLDVRLPGCGFSNVGFTLDDFGCLRYYFSRSVTRATSVYASETFLRHRRLSDPAFFSTSPNTHSPFACGARATVRLGGNLVFDDCPLGGTHTPPALGSLRRLGVGSDPCSNVHDRALHHAGF